MPIKNTPPPAKPAAPAAPADSKAKPAPKKNDKK